MKGATMTNCTTRRRTNCESGVALLMVMISLSLLFLLIFALLGSGLLESRISGNYRSQTQTFYVAEAGIERAKDWLKTNLGDAAVLNALLTEAVGASLNAPPDQSSLMVGGTPMVTPLGAQTFGDGTYTVWIGDNTDDGDLTTDSDGLFVITALGNGADNSGHAIEVVVSAPHLNPSAAINLHGNDVHPDLDQGSGGTGNQIPPGEMSGFAHDINGTPGAAGCTEVPLLSTDDPAATAELLDDLDDLRKDIIKRANAFCADTGSPSTIPGGPGGTCTGSNCCTPGLWWIRGSAVSPRFDDTDPASYSLLDLSAPQLHATNADYVSPTQPPTVTWPTPETVALGGGAGNTADPAVSQVTPDQLVDELVTIQNSIDASEPADKITITDGRFDDGGTHTYGTVAVPKVVTVTDYFRIEGNTTFQGAGILVVDNRMRLEQDSTFNWTGVVIIRGTSPEFESRGGGTVNGAFYFDSTDGTVVIDVDKATDELAITFSCEAVTMALNQAPMTTVSWVELHQ